MSAIIFRNVLRFRVDIAKQASQAADLLELEKRVLLQKGAQKVKGRYRATHKSGNGCVCLNTISESEWRVYNITPLLKAGLESTQRKLFSK